jgi:class 3 adenylate cyclase
MISTLFAFVRRLAATLTGIKVGAKAEKMEADASTPIPIPTALPGSAKTAFTPIEQTQRPNHLAGDSINDVSRLSVEITTLRRVSEIINSPLPLTSILQQVIGEVVENSRLSVAWLFLLDEEENLKLRAAADPTSKGEQRLDHWEFTLPSITVATGQPLLIPDLKKWSPLRSFVPSSEVVSTLWLPVWSRDRVSGAIGALGVGSTEKEVLDQDMIRFLSTVAAQLAIAVENAKLFRQVAAERRTRLDLQSYLSPRAVQAVTAGKSSPGTTNEPRRMSILFADVRRFTTLVEKTDTEIVIRLLNEYFSRVQDIVSECGGMVDELAGDRILASFDSGCVGQRDARQAVTAGLEILAALDALQESWRHRGLPTFEIGIGISTGTVTTGSIGSQERKSLVTTGETLNIAWRTEQKSREFNERMIITESTFEQVKDIIDYKELGPVRLAGVSRPIKLYSVYGMKREAGR